MKPIADWSALPRPYPVHRGPVMAANGMIATAHPLASATGLDVLQRGGTFMDAALAAAAVLNVVEPYNSNLGGDVFMIVHDARAGETVALNGSGNAPATATPDRFPNGIPTDGLAAASVPGQVHGWLTAHERWCTWDLADLFAPAIRYAEDGFPANMHLARALQGVQERIRPYPSSRKVLGTVPKPGTLWANPELGRTLRTIAKGGIDAFQRGEIAERIASFCAENGGFIGMDDMAAHETIIGPPISTPYRGYTVYEQPLVSQGHILLQELNIVEGFDLAASGPLGADTVHRSVEAKKLAFADKHRYSGDPAHGDIPLGMLLSKEFAATRRAQIGETALADPPAGEPVDHDTTYFCAADRDGNAVSFIQSIFHGFGCGVVIEGTGMLMNNRMACFTLDPENPNCLAPGKRPIHTLNTYMVYDGGRPLIVGGTPGGDVQVQTNLQVLQKLLDFGWNPQEAVEAPRWSHETGLGLALEGRFPPDVVAELRRRGHAVAETGPFDGSGNAQVILIHPESGAYVAGSDPRGDGCAMGW